MYVPSLWYVALMTLAASLSAGPGAVLAVSEPTPVVIDYFFERGCADCYRVERHVLPELEERFRGIYALQEFDVGIPDNVSTLIAYQEKLNIEDNEPVCMVLDRKYVLNGYGAIRKGLTEQINICLAERQEDGWTLPAAIMGKDASGDSVLRERLRSFRWLALAVAGFVDGINPCSISTLVFFASMLGVSGIRNRRLLAAGLSFCAATFATYFLIGFGLLRALHGLAAFPAIRMSVNAVMFLALGVLSAVSFLDAWRYSRSHLPGDIGLQLPNQLKLMAHGVIRDKLRWGSLVAGACTAGVLVTGIESVCTGQVYVPTLALAVKTGESTGWALTGLLLYNLAFIVPLAGVLACCYAGVGSQKLVQWSRRHTALAKAIMGLFFLALGIIGWFIASPIP